MKRTALALLLGAAMATPAFAKGPPWISIESRPYGMYFLIARTYHHGTPMALPLTGTAEGLVGGRRTSVTLRFDQEGDANAFAVANTWGSSGVWVLNIGTSAEHGGAGVVVGVDRTGGQAFVRFPRAAFGSRMATRAEVDAMLRALEAGQPPPALTAAGSVLLFVRGILPPLSLATIVTCVLWILATVGQRLLHRPADRVTA